MKLKSTTLVLLLFFGVSCAANNAAPEIRRNDKNSLVYKVDIGPGKTVDVVFDFKCVMHGNFPMLVGTNTGYGLNGKVQYKTPSKALVDDRVAKKCADLSEITLKTDNVISIGDTSNNSFLAEKALSVYANLISANELENSSGLSSEEVEVLKNGFSANKVKENLIRVVSLTITNKSITFLITKKSSSTQIVRHHILIKVGDSGKIYELNSIEDTGQYY